MSNSQAIVNIPLVELDELRSSRAQAFDQVAELSAQLEAERLTDKTGKVRELNELLRECLVIVRFAIANLTPETTHKWPTLQLKGIADRLMLLPDRTVDDADFATLIRGFRREIAEAERIRASRALLPEDAEKRLAEVMHGLDDDKPVTVIDTRPEIAPVGPHS